MNKSLLKTKKTAFLVFLLAGLMFAASVLSVILFPNAKASIVGAIPVASEGKNTDKLISVVKDPALDTKQYIDPDKIYGDPNGFVSGDDVRVMIVVDDRSLVTKYNESAYKDYEDVSSYINSLSGQNYASTLISKQNSVKKQLSAKFDIKFDYTFTALLNGFSATVKYEDIDKIEELPYVSRVVKSERYAAPEVSSYDLLDIGTGDPVTNNVEIDPTTGIFDGSNSGFNGEGTLIAVLDTGIDYTHSAFKTPLTNPDKAKITADKEYLKERLGNMVAGSEMYGYTHELTPENVYVSEKIPFAYDYADRDYEVFPVEEHGTHVAGIIAGKDSVITGVAPEAQLAIMKVFPDSNTGSNSEEILAAVEDCVRLGVDSINMSLGRDSGFATEEGDRAYTNMVYQHVEDAGITLVAAASNSYSSGFNSTYGSNLTSNPDSGTVGSPSTYNAALSVASISGKKSPYLLANNTTPVYFNNSVDNNGEQIEFLDDLFKKQKFTGDTVTLEYVVIPGTGDSTNYTGIDVRGKVALIKRGTNTFEDKIKFAQDKGAIATMIYNNVAGDITMVIGKDDVIPSCSISMDLGKILVDAAAANKAAGKGNGGTLYIDRNNFTAGPFMSAFTSWGPSPDLELKPEITAHGGDIYSAVIGGEYDHMSGTSMASPNLCGIATLLRQHLEKNYENYAKSDWKPEDKVKHIHRLVNQLLMSTATPALSEVGDPYSPRRQGAGLANLTASINTDAYLYVKDEDSKFGELDKTKLSLGDDPDRKGEYELKFNIRNISESSLRYSVDIKVMTETVSSDQRTVAEKAYMIEDSEISLEAEQGSNIAISSSNGKYTLTVPGNADGEITIKIKLSQNIKDYLDKNFKNGMYVEGFVDLLPPGTNGYALNIPYLAFYGDWSDAPLLDKDWKTIYEDKSDDSIPEDDKVKADVFPVSIIGKREIDGVVYAYYLGDYVYERPEDGNYPYPEFHDDFLSLSRYEESLYDIYMVAGFLRNAKVMHVTITHAETGELMAKKDFYNACKAGAGSAGGILTEDSFSVSRFVSENGKMFEEGNRYTFEFSCELDYRDGKANNNSYAFDFVIDSSPPTIEDFELRVEYQPNDTVTRYRYYLDMYFFDNNYPTGYQIRYYDKNAQKYVSPVGNYMIPINATKNSITKVTTEITDYWEQIKESDYTLFISTSDYSMNDVSYYVKLVDLENKEYGIYNNVEELALKEEYTDTEEITANTLKDVLRINESYNLLAALDVTSRWDKDYEKFAEDCVAAGLAEKNEETGEYNFDSSVVISNWLETKRDAWFEDYEFTSSDEQTIIVSDKGMISPRKEGSATITIKSRTTDAELKVFVRAGTDKYRENINISDVKLSYSRLILPVGATYEITCEVLPWNNTVKDYRIKWQMEANENVSFEEDPNDNLKVYVTGLKETISLDTVWAQILYARVQIKEGDEYVDSLCAGTCFINVPEEFVVTYGTLTEYNGAAKELHIPDDLGIKTIGSVAFYQNPTLEKVYIPEGVKKIEQAAFAYCPNLEFVQFPSTLQSIGTWAFGGWIDYLGPEEAYLTSKLTTVKIDTTKGPSQLRYIGANAFAYNYQLSEIDLSSVVSIDDSAFLNCTRLHYTETDNGNFNTETLDLRSAKSIGEYAFAYCGLLMDVHFEADTDIGYQAFAGDSLLGYQSSEPLTITSTRIGDGAFSDCGGILEGEKYGISNVVFTGNNVLIGREVFKGCSNLSTVTFNGTVKEIGAGAFEDCISLRDIALPNGLKMLGDDAFKNCNSLTILRISSKVDLKELNASAFTGVNLRSIQMIDGNNETLTVKNNALYSKDGSTLIMVLPSNQISSETLLDGVENISSYAFFGNQNLETIDLKGIKTIGTGAFEGCTKLRSVTVREAIDLSPHAFDGCTLLTDVNFEDSGCFNSVGAYAFANCKSLNSINLKGSFNKIETGVFQGDEQLTQVTTENNITEIGDYAFSSCSLLTDFDISNVKNDNALSEDRSSLGSIGYAAFLNCTSYNPEQINARIINDYAFSGASALTVANLPETQYIGNFAFSESGITNLTLTKTSIIGAYAFGIAYDYLNNDAPQKTSKLESIDLGVVEYIGYGAFSGAVDMDTIEIPETTNFIGKYAFADTGLTEINVAPSNPCFTSIDGVLYRIVPNGYELMSYPTMKTVEETENGEGETVKLFTVADKTIRIETGAFINVKGIEEINLSYELMYIGNFAFFGCDNLKTYNFNSYRAPMLEFDIESVDDYRTVGYIDPRFKQDVDEDVNEDITFGVNGNNTNRIDYVVPHYYNFGYMEDYDLDNINLINRMLSYPKNGFGYTDRIFASFFAASKAVRTDKIVKDENTVVVIKDLKALPDVNTLDTNTEREYVAKFRNAYNAYVNLDKDQKDLVDQEQDVVAIINNVYNKLVALDLLQEKFSVRFMFTDEDGTLKAVEGLSEQNIVYGKRLGKPASDPVREGYTFDGYYSNAACTRTYNFDLTSITKDTIIYVKWIKNESNNNGDGNEDKSGCSCGTFGIADNFGGYFGGGILILTLVGTVLLLRRKRSVSK